MPVNSILTNDSVTHRQGVQFETNFVKKDNIKKDMVMFFNSGCPRGWLQYTTGASRVFRFASSSIETTGGSDSHSHTGTSNAFGGVDGIKSITGSGSKPNYDGGFDGATVTTSSSTLAAPKYKLMACYKVSNV